MAQVVRRPSHRHCLVPAIVISSAKGRVGFATKSAQRAASVASSSRTQSSVAGPAPSSSSRPWPNFQIEIAAQRSVQQAGQCLVFARYFSEGRHEVAAVQGGASARCQAAWTRTLYSWWTLPGQSWRFTKDVAEPESDLCFAWVSRSHSAISSRKMVPPSASSNAPLRSLVERGRVAGLAEQQPDGRHRGRTRAQVQAQFGLDPVLPVTNLGQLRVGNPEDGGVVRGLIQLDREGLSVWSSKRESSYSKNAKVGRSIPLLEAGIQPFKLPDSAAFARLALPDFVRGQTEPGRVHGKYGNQL